MSEFAGSRPITRAASKTNQNYGAQPMTAIRNKFEKPRGHIGKSKNTTHDIENEICRFADGTSVS